MPRWWTISAARMRECQKFWRVCRVMMVADVLVKKYGMEPDLARAFGIMTVMTEPD